MAKRKLERPFWDGARLHPRGAEIEDPAPLPELEPIKPASAAPKKKD